MNAFKILDKNNIAIPINSLDKEVCEIVGVEPDNKEYCRLGKREEYPEGIKGSFEFYTGTTNWYDSIGWMIASENKSFQDIIDYYTNLMSKYLGKKDENGNIITIETIYPYHMKVLKTWINKGYKAVQILEKDL